MSKPEARIINTDSVNKDRIYEPPLVIAWGVDEATTGTKTITIALQMYGPGRVWFDDLKADYAK